MLYILLYTAMGEIQLLTYLTTTRYIPLLRANIVRAPAMYSYRPGDLPMSY